MRFSNTFQITRNSADDWFDSIPSQDTPLYVDPYLVFDDNDAFWSSSMNDLVKFFELAASFVVASEGERSSPAWAKAVRLLRFPEPAEFALGTSLGSPFGAGTGADFAIRMADVLALIGETNAKRLAGIAGFTVFCEGFGRDRLSDVLCNIIKGRFIEYTQSVCQRHQVPMQLVEVKHSSWSSRRGIWVDGRSSLPISPATDGPVLLTPERFLKDLPRVSANGFWDWTSTQDELKQLRESLNFDLAEGLSASRKVDYGRRLARSAPEVALDYLKIEDGKPHLPYDVDLDPDRLVGWFESGQALADGVDVVKLQATDLAASDFNNWIEKLAVSFKDAVENNEGWKLLWNEGRTKHLEEKIAQALAGIMWQAECRAANVDLSREVNMGRGPVDFKFSKGWEKRGLLEVKYIENRKFFSGLSRQLPKYLETEKIDFGVYLAIGFRDLDFTDERLERVAATCSALKSKAGVEIRSVVVDARTSTKKSASTL